MPPQPQLQLAASLPWDQPEGVKAIFQDAPTFGVPGLAPQPAPRNRVELQMRARPGGQLLLYTADQTLHWIRPDGKKAGALTLSQPALDIAFPTEGKAIALHPDGQHAVRIAQYSLGQPDAEWQSQPLPLGDASQAALLATAHHSFLLLQRQGQWEAQEILGGGALQPCPSSRPLRSKPVAAPGDRLFALTPTEGGLQGYQWQKGQWQLLSGKQYPASLAKAQPFALDTEGRLVLATGSTLNLHGADGAAIGEWRSYNAFVGEDGQAYWQVAPPPSDAQATHIILCPPALPPSQQRIQHSPQVLAAHPLTNAYLVGQSAKGLLFQYFDAQRQPVLAWLDPASSAVTHSQPAGTDLHQQISRAQASSTWAHDGDASLYLGVASPLAFQVLRMRFE